MTTVAVAGRTMAADTRFTIGDAFYDSGKLDRIGDFIVSTAGCAAEGDSFMDWVRRGRRGARKKVSASFEALLLRRDGGIFYVLGNDRMRQIRQKFYAIGSGSYYALGALSMQARTGWPLDPELAVSISMEWDPATQGHIDVLTWQAQGPPG